ncbi:hypothetical protein HAX54_024539 [Datura stramonium]|uniref:Uncharacterized protein n=1 Tax=Datura stramonium TaxID=4076 RepID=A0ABS8S7F0_DATST|nr:hypothetical protein [Datura stramonium]
MVDRTVGPHSAACFLQPERTSWHAAGDDHALFYAAVCEQFLDFHFHYISLEPNNNILVMHNCHMPCQNLDDDHVPRQSSHKCDHDLIPNSRANPTYTPKSFPQRVDQYVNEHCARLESPRHLLFPHDLEPDNLKTNQQIILIIANFNLFVLMNKNLASLLLNTMDFVEHTPWTCMFIDDQDVGGYWCLSSLNTCYFHIFGTEAGLASRSRLLGRATFEEFHEIDNNFVSEAGALGSTHDLELEVAE